MKLKKYSALACGVLASAIIAACSGGNGASSGKQTLTPMNTSSASVKALTAATNGVANLRSIAKGNGVYVAVGDGGAILTSSDGQKWGSVSSGISIDLHEVTFNDSAKLFYAVGDKSIVLSSANGTSWTQYQPLVPSEDLYSIMSVGGDLVIGAESSTIFEIDTNGTGVVTVRNTADNMKLISAAHGNGMMVLGGDDGSILYKSESNWGANWSKSTQFSGMSINGLSYESADHWFLAGTSTGKVIRSGDGVVWSSPITASNFIINSVILDDKSNDFFAVGGSSDTSMMVISNNYNSWNPLTLPFNNVQLNDVKCFDNNDCFIVGDNGTILTGLTRDNNNPSLPIWVAAGGPDVTAPTVTMSTPSDKAIDVSKSPSIQIQFSETVENVSKSNVSLHIGSPAGASVAIDSITGGADNVYTINPSVVLSDNMTYYVVIGNGITDLTGNPLLATNFSFTTGDNTAPTVVMSTPADQASNVSKSPTIQIQFSEGVRGVESNVSLHIGSVAGTTVAIGVVSSGANNTYTFSPSVALTDTTKYYVVIGSGVTDLSGNAISTTSFSFTTGDFTAPTVTMISPANNTTNITTMPTIQLQFSETVKNVTSATVSLRESSVTGATVALGTITAGSNNSYSFIPSATLKNKTIYYVIVSSGVTDASGNALASSQFSFTTKVAGGASTKYAYILSAAGSSYVKCTVNTDGSLTDCVDSGPSKPSAPDPAGGSTTVPAFHQPSSIAISGGYAYVTNSYSNDNSYAQCAIDGSDGSLYACNKIQPLLTGYNTSALQFPYGVAISNGFAYFTNAMNTTYTQCKVSSAGGTLSLCAVASTTPGALSNPNGITINNGYAYIINNNNSYTQCKISNTDGTLTTCTTTTPASPGALSYPKTMAISNGNAYITNTGNNSYTKCAVNATTGNLTGCTTKVLTGVLNQPVGLAIYNGKAYITNAGNRSYTICQVTTDLTGCTTTIPTGTGAIVQPVGIAIN